MPNLISLHEFYRDELPSLLHQRNPNPLSWAPSPNSPASRNGSSHAANGGRVFLDFVSSLDDCSVRSASEKAFRSPPGISKAVSALAVLKRVGPATFSAVNAAYAPETAPFMSDEERLWRQGLETRKVNR